MLLCTPNGDCVPLLCDDAVLKAVHCGFTDTVEFISVEHVSDRARPVQHWKIRYPYYFSMWQHEAYPHIRRL